MIIGICLLIGLFIARHLKPGCDVFAKMKKECDENGWTIAEFVESIESMKSTESTENMESTESAENMESTESAESAESMESMESR